MQVRTKKRYFIPPAVNKKKETNRDIEERLRAAGTVPPQEIVERQINISCTGNGFFFFTYSILFPHTKAVSNDSQLYFVNYNTLMLPAVI